MKHIDRKRLSNIRLFNDRVVKLMGHRGASSHMHFEVETYDNREFCLLPRNISEHFDIYTVWWQFRNLYIPDSIRLDS